MLFKEKTTTENIKKTSVDNRYSFIIASIGTIILLSTTDNLNLKILLFSSLFSFLSMALNEINNEKREHFIAIIQIIIIIVIVAAISFYSNKTNSPLEIINLMPPIFGFYGLYGFYLKQTKK